MRRPIHLLVLFLALAVAAPLAACGDSEASAQEVIASAPGKTIDEHTAKVAMTITLEGPQSFTMQGDGLFDLKAQRGRMTLDMSSLGLPGTGQSEVVFTGNVIYMKLGLPIPELAARPWIKMDLEQLSKQAGFDLAQLQQLQNNDPTAALNYLRGASDDVTEVGKDEVRGVDTTHYRATLDLRKAAAELPENLKADLERAIELLGSNELPAEMWVDDDGRLRKMTMNMDLSKVQGQAVQGTMRITMEFYEFGVDVEITEPPADQVTDFGTLLAGPGQG